ncbi:hypothetical protein [Mesorhizobium sp. IMUNJ 23232]|uniref:hypothetical protein n=1 Tax=Mesorhizobium sp. IMUNJ 23232 TaxID=3376064 RepID=UPI0037A5064C
MIETFMRKTDTKQVCAELAMEGLIQNTWRVGASPKTTPGEDDVIGLTPPSVTPGSDQPPSQVDQTSRAAALVQPALSLHWETSAK